MPEKVTAYVTLLMYALAAISGGLGGCAVAGHQVLRGITPRVSYVVAYATIGIMFGVLALAYGALIGINQSMDTVIGSSVLAGAVGSITLASTNISARWILRRLGIEVQVTVRKRDSDKQQGQGDNGPP